MAKERLDALLMNRGLFESRARAQAAVMAGQVLVNEQKIDKPGTQVSPDVTIRLLGDKLRYVSRGGLKLEKALQIFPISVDGKVVADIGASTGGFTDCALQNGAAKVYAVDVGYGQLAWKLRSDERVVNMERTNVDPPYFNTDDTYSRTYGMKWTESDERHLYDMLADIDKHGGKFMLTNTIINNGVKNEYLDVFSKKYHTISTDCDFNGCSYQRKNKKTREIIVKNY